MITFIYGENLFVIIVCFIGGVRRMRAGEKKNKYYAFELQFKIQTIKQPSQRNVHERKKHMHE